MSVTESRVFYLMGASGAGKDALMRRCRGLLTEADRCFVAHRYITREPETAGENHIWLSAAEFDKRLKLGAFAMHWAAHGHRYAIGAEIDHWLDCGISVLVNGSRAFLPEARARYHHRLVAVLVSVDAAALRARLQQRGRETATEIEQRVTRAADLLPAGPLVQVDNSGALEQAATALLRLVRGDGVASDQPDRPPGWVVSPL